MLQHQQSTVPVYTSDRYTNFNMIQGNRTLDMNKIKRILSDIDEGTNLLPYFPILVVVKGGKLDIIDGQHRYMVAKKIKHPVYYIIAQELSLYQIARLNSNTEKWKYVDYINCYTQLGNKSYKMLDDLLKQYPKLPVTTAVNLLCEGKVGTGGGQLMGKFKKGQFEAIHGCAAKAICEKIDQFEFEHKFSRYFMIALSKVILSDIFPVEDLIAKVNADPGALRMQDHWRQYLTNLEEIASKGKHKRVAIY